MQAKLQQMTANAGKAVGDSSSGADKEAHEEQVNTLEKELKLKQAELAKTKNENMEAERNLKKLSSKKEHEVGDNIEQYDKSMEELNEEIMATWRERMRPFYYDADRYDTYLEQLGIEYPTIRTRPISEDRDEGRH